jgi:simple sugar transport system ATP-binding protein
MAERDKSGGGKIKKMSLLETRDISVEFPGVRALSSVRFTVESGRIHALAGANGAGKSTLMKVLSGVNGGYTGNIAIDGKACEIRSPSAAKLLGIETVYQEVDIPLFPTLSAAENIMNSFMAGNARHGQFVDWRHIRREARDALEKLGAKIDVRKTVSELTLAEKQIVLLARAIREKCRFLLLDEPTAPLSPFETETLFGIIRRLAKEENTAVVFISHRIPEIFDLCEHITVMRDGKIAAEEEINEHLTAEKVIEYMLGKKNTGWSGKKRNTSNKVLLECKNLNEAGGRVRNINFSLKAGEIIAFAGLVGAGKTELCKTVFGEYRTASGELRLRGRKIRVKTPEAAARAGCAFVPEERRREGLFIGDPFYSNITISSINKYLSRYFSGAGFVQKKKQIEAAREQIKNLNIKIPSPLEKVSLLSGGNQQKTVIGKWLSADAEVYIFDEPTKGIDVGAKEEIFALIEELSSRGKGIIYASCEFGEILRLADRIYVMYDGEIVTEKLPSETDEKNLLYYASGAWQAGIGANI